MTGIDGENNEAGKGGFGFFNGIKAFTIKNSEFLSNSA